jgi:hypothetical protein
VSAVVAVFAVGVYAYQVGVSANQARTAQLEADLARFQHDNLDLGDRAASATRQAAEAEAALKTMRERYSAEIPSGGAADLLAQLREQLAAGVEPERLAMLIEAAGQENACQTAPVTKRFMPRTPISTGPVSYVRFDDRITVIGVGESARNEAGLPEAWYDPARPVRLEFRTLDGAVTSVEGIAPLAHRMVVDGKEYRFSAVSGDARFLEVTAQACSLLDPADAPDAASAGAAGTRQPRAEAPDPRPLTD